MSKTSRGIQNVLTKAKRKFGVVCIDDNYTENAYAELYCIKCGGSLGKCELHYRSHECYKYCVVCIKDFIRPVPMQIAEDISMLEDSGNMVIIRYENIRQEEYKQCYFSSKGRYINIKGKRKYIP